MDNLTTKKADRFRFLNRLYERVDGDTNAVVEMSALGGELGIGLKAVEKIVDYLVGEHLVELQGIGTDVCITHRGVVEVEKALSQPSQATHYFPAVVNVLQIQSMVGSQVQQGTHSSVQSLNFTNNELEAIRALVDQLAIRLPQLPLEAEGRSEAEAELETLRAQLKSAKPKATILRESLRTLRSLVEGVASTAISAEVLPLFAPLAAWLSGTT